MSTRPKPLHPGFRARMAHGAMGLDIRASGPSTPEADAQHAAAVKASTAEWEREYGPEVMPRLLEEYERELAAWKAEQSNGEPADD